SEQVRQRELTDQERLDRRAKGPYGPARNVCETEAQTKLLSPGVELFLGSSPSVEKRTERLGTALRSVCEAIYTQHHIHNAHKNSHLTSTGTECREFVHGVPKAQYAFSLV